MISRRRGALALALTVTVVGAGFASAAPIHIPLPPLEFETKQLRVSPRILPDRQRVPVSLGGRGKVSTRDGSHPSALREAVVDIDRDVAFDVEGLPTCRRGPRYDIRDPGAVRRACRGAVLGWGTASLGFAFPESTSIRQRFPITVFNLGAKGQSIRLVVYGFISIPRPTDVAATVELRPTPGGNRGWQAMIDIPVIAGGAGSLLGVNLKVRRRYLSDHGPRSFVSARCPDGSLKVAVPKLLFRNESEEPSAPAQTIMKGLTHIPCSPKG